jgi:hypothetical protein
MNKGGDTNAECGVSKMLAALSSPIQAAIVNQRQCW